MKKVKVKVRKKKKKYTNGGTFEQADMPYQVENVGTGKYVTANYNAPKVDGASVFTQAANTLAPVVGAMGQRKDGYQDVGAQAASGALQGAASGAAMGSVIGPWGTVIGGAVGAIGGGIYSGINAKKKNEEVLANVQEEKRRADAQKENYAKAILNTYPTSGVKGAEYYQEMGGKIKYAHGGQMPMNGGSPVQTEGGQLVPNSNDTMIAQGNSHAQGGIQLPNGEIEGGEVLQADTDGVNVYSDKLEVAPGITYAAAAEKISTKKGKYEENLNANSPFVKGSAERQTEKLDNELEDLFNRQEQMKIEQGIENPQGQAPYGGTFNNTFQQALPYVDNLTNAILTSKTPEIPVPEYDEAVRLRTNVNINPQLAESKRQMSNLQTGLARNTQDSNTMRNQMIAATSGNIKNTNQLYGQKENMETRLVNRSLMNQQQVAAQNTSKKNQYALNKMNRVDDIHQRISANAANASTDAQLQVAEQNRYRRDLMELDIIKKKYQETGVWDRNLEGVFNDYLKDGDEVNLMEKAKNLGKKAVDAVKELLKGKQKNQVGRLDKKISRKQGTKTPIMDDAYSERYGVYTG